MVSGSPRPDAEALQRVDEALREQWALGARLLLCWAMQPQGLRILWAPHDFLGQFTASMNDRRPEDRLEALNGSFLRRLIAGSRCMSNEDLDGTARRFGLPVDEIGLPGFLPWEGTDFLLAIERTVKRYSISYVESRAAILIDIADFSVFTPFEQTSQLNSLSYSLNSAYGRLLRNGIALDFTRTTTGDGFYVWNRDTGPMASVHLFQFMVLALADNARARRAARGNTAPAIRTAFHIGSHYEFHQADGVNPTLFSYIVGDLTIELARMVASAAPGQILIGDFHAHITTSARDGAFPIEVDTERFVDRARRGLRDLQQLDMDDWPVHQLWCFLSGETGASGGESVRRFRVVDKHQRSRDVYNLMVHIQSLGREPVLLGSTTPPERQGDEHRPRLSPVRRWQ